MRRTRPRPSAAPKVRRNAEGKPRERFEGLRDENYRAWIREQRCLLHGDGCRYVNHQSDAAHVESKARRLGRRQQPGAAV